MADERDEDGAGGGVPIEGGGDAPEGAIPRPRGPESPAHVSTARFTLSPSRDCQRFVTNRRFHQTTYDDDTPHWGYEGVRRSMDVETAL